MIVIKAIKEIDFNIKILLRFWPELVTVHLTWIIDLGPSPRTTYRGGDTQELCSSPRITYRGGNTQMLCPSSRTTNRG